MRSAPNATRQLLLLRHAQAQAARAGLDDVDRPLTDTGRQEALDAAQCIIDGALRVEAMLVSPALRARETATLIAAQLDITGGYQIVPSLYPGESGALLQAMHAASNDWRAVLLIGHNPGLSELASQLCGTRVELGTAGLYSINCNASAWTEIDAQHVHAFECLR